MNLRSIANTTVQAAQFGATLLAGHVPPQMEGVEAFWVSSRRLVRNWFGRIESLTLNNQQLACPPDALSLMQATSADTTHKSATASRMLINANNESLTSLLEEILVGEVVTRVWSAVLVAADHRFGLTWAEPLARQAFSWQLEVKIRCLTELCEALQHPQPLPTEIDPLRRRLERWTDLLLGALIRHPGVSEFAFDVRRAQDSAEIFSPPHYLASPWPLIQVAYPQSLTDRALDSPVAAENFAAVAHSIRVSAPKDCFHSDGPIRSTRWLRLASN